MSFDGENDNIVINNQSNVDFNNQEITISADVLKIGDNQQRVFTVGEDGSASQQAALLVTGDGNLYFLNGDDCIDLVSADKLKKIHGLI